MSCAQICAWRKAQRNFTCGPKRRELEMEELFQTRSERRERGCGWCSRRGVQVFFCLLLLDCCRCSPSTCENAVCPSPPTMTTGLAQTVEWQQGKSQCSSTTANPYLLYLPHTVHCSCTTGIAGDTILFCRCNFEALLPYSHPSPHYDHWTPTNC